jgi:hypothetical protein
VFGCSFPRALRPTSHWVHVPAALVIGAAIFVAGPNGSALAKNAAAAGGFATDSDSWDGLSEFVALVQGQAGAGRLRLRATLDYDQLSPRDAVVIVHPDKGPSSDDLTRFLSAGGRVAVIDDFGASQAFLSRFGIHRQSPPLEPTLRAMGNANLPIAVPTTERVAGVEKGRHPTTEHVDLVVTNHPVVFSHPHLTPILEIEGQDGPPAALALSGVIAGKGRLVVVGDPSIFINLMLRYPGNRAFASGLVDYLLSPDASAPGAEGRLWLVVGDFDEVGAFGEPSWLERMTAKKDELAESLRSVDEDGLPKPLVLALGACVLLALLRFELGEQLRAPPPTRPRFARPSAVSAHSGPAGRMAVLAAAETTPLLAILELGAALEESLAEHLGHSAPNENAGLEAELRAHGWLSADASRMVAVVARHRAYRARLTDGRQNRPSEAEANRIHRETMDVLGNLRWKAERSRPLATASRGGRS